MTAIQSTNFADAPAGHLGIIGRIGKLAFPLMVGALAAAGLQVVKAAILSHNGEEAALYTLSMMQPSFIFMLAFLESLAITNQVFSSKSVTNWAKGDVLRATRIFSIIGLVLTALIALGFYGASFAVAGQWPEAAELMPKMALFVLSLAPYLLFELRNAALRGQGKTGQALVPFIVLIVADIAITWFCVFELGLGFNGVLIGNALGPLVALPLVVWMLRREIGDSPKGEAGQFKKNVIGLTIGVAGPVFVSMFAGSASAAIIFPALAMLGQDLASGFLVIVRVRIMFIIPAIAIGSAIAILINQLPENGHVSEKRGILVVGVTTVLAIYALATFGVFLLRDEAVGLVVPAENAALYATTVDLMMVLIVTFFLVAAFTMLQVILEHLGMGVRVLIVTFITEVITIGLVFAALFYDFGVAGVLHSMNVMAAASFLLLGGVFVIFLRKMGRTDAV